MDETAISDNQERSVFGTRDIILYMQILLKPVSLITGFLLVITKNRRVRDPKISLVVSIFNYNRSRYQQYILV